MTETATASSSHQSSEAEVARFDHRAGGLTKPPKGELFGVFSVLMTVVYVDFLVFLMTPFAMYRHTDHPWAGSPRLGFVAFSIGFSLVYGITLSVMADRRGRSPWWFLGGHAGAFAAPLIASWGWAEEASTRAMLTTLGLSTVGAVISLIVLGSPKLERASKLGLLTHVMGKLWHRIGNIWVGIFLMSVMAVALYQGTWWESDYGNKSAMHVFYTSTWFGIAFLLFSASLISATFRKFPWRIDQAGWLTVHAALIMIIIGSFMSFWGKVEGSLRLEEKQSSSSFYLNTETRLEVYEIDDRRGGTTKIWETISDFDLDPSQKDPSRTYAVTDRGEELFKIHVERYYGNGRQVTKESNLGEKPLYAVSGRLKTPIGQSVPVSVSEQRPVPFMQSFQMEVRRPTALEGSLEAIKAARDIRGHGLLRVMDQDDRELMAIPIDPMTREDMVGPAELTFRETIPGTDVVLSGSQYFDDWNIPSTSGAAPVDANPGIPNNPAVRVKFEGPEGEDTRWSFAWYPELSEELSQRAAAYGNYRLIYDFVPMPPGVFRLTRDDQGQWFGVYNDGSRLHSDVLEPGVDFPVGASGMVFTPKEFFDHYEAWESWEFVDHIPDFQVAKFRVEGAELDPAKEHWMVLGSQAFAQKDGINYLIRWTMTSHPLGFELTLDDFHRDFYPGSTEPRTFESWLKLTHPEKFPSGVDILIDMNHPLRLDGWRLYQHRFSANEVGEATVLQINRDPGLFLTYFACGVLTLGLVIVFFQKPFLRRLTQTMNRRKASPMMKFVAASLVVLAAFAATLPGVFVFATMSEGVLLLLAVVLIVVGLVGETVLLNTYMSKKIATGSLDAAG